MKKIISVLLILIMLLSLTSCEGYIATMLVRVNTNDYCSASWSTLEGTLLLNTTKKSGAGESAIHYTASLEEGELTVYYYVRPLGDEQKIELFSLKDGESIEDRGGYVEMNNNIQIIIETNGKTKGGSIKIDFE